MAKKILNITNQCWYKRGHVERMLDDCSVGWLERGVSIRNLTPDESRAAKLNRIAGSDWLNDPLPYRERPGLRFDPPSSGVPATRREGILAWEAHQASVGNFVWLDQPWDMKMQTLEKWLKELGAPLLERAA